MKIMEQKVSENLKISKQMKTNSRSRHGSRGRDSKPPLAFFVGRVVNIFFPNAVEHQSSKRREYAYKPNNYAHRRKPWYSICKKMWPRASMGGGRESTRQVVNEGNRDGAADDGVDPEPPACGKYSAGDAWPEDCPQFGQIHFLRFSI